MDLKVDEAVRHVSKRSIDSFTKREDPKFARAKQSDIGLVGFGEAT